MCVEEIKVHYYNVDPLLKPLFEGKQIDTYYTYYTYIQGIF